VLKDGPVEDVVAGIHAAAAGESLISPRIAAILLGRIHDRERVQRDLPPIALSERELQVLGLVSQGRANDEIGGSLGMSPASVVNHISSVLMKLQVESRVEAAVRHRALPSE
jgi:DNA-binding NarL/FixJ family response regulator